MNMTTACCGREYFFQPPLLLCHGKKLCTVPKGAEYWCLPGGINYCLDCFSDEPSNSITFGDDLVINKRRIQVRKEHFILMKNVSNVKEPIIVCSDCKKHYHEICVLYSSQINSEKYVCDSCLVNKGKKRRINSFAAKDLNKTKLSIYIEEKVNEFLENLGIETDITICVVVNPEGSTKVKQGMQSRYDWPDKFPYKSKIIFAFQKQEGVDVCFFAMHVQEYDNTCPMPNTRKVYISCIDTVPFFNYAGSNSDRATAKDPLRYISFKSGIPVHHEIILCYLNYIKMQGYISAHVWTCSARKSGYIFNCHPDAEKMPNIELLQDWFYSLFEKAHYRGIILDYNNTSVQTIKSISELPYFDGDFLPVAFEKCVKELKEEEIAKLRAKKAFIIMYDNIDENDENVDSTNMWQVVDYKTKDRSKEAYVARTEMTLLTKVSNALTDYAEMSFVINLNAESTENLPTTSFTRDDDSLILTVCEASFNKELSMFFRKNSLEFSSIRQAKYSTMILLYFLILSQTKLRNCKRCRAQIALGYRCTSCDDYALCIVCHDGFSVTHAHVMEVYCLNYNNTTIANRNDQLNFLSVDFENFSTDYFELHTLCHRMEINFNNHMKSCSGNSCLVCLKFDTYHSILCQNENCPFARCTLFQTYKYKQKIQFSKLIEEILNRTIDIMENFSTSITDPKEHTQSSELSQSQIEYFNWCCIS